jgi:hypothetical protein
MGFTARIPLSGSVYIFPNRQRVREHLIFGTKSDKVAFVDKQLALIALKRPG